MRETQEMSERTGLITADDFARLPDDDYRYELVSGRVIRMSPTGGVHGVLVVRLAGPVDAWVREHGLGLVMTETGFRLAENPDTVRAPDLAFVAQHRIPAGGVPRGFWMGPPDLAVEVLSPDDHAADIRAKVGEYLTHGVRLVWVIDPDEKTVTSYRPSEAPVTAGVEDGLSGGDVLPGFGMELQPLFL